MIQLSEGALDQIMEGVEVDKPVLQILGHKRLITSISAQERFRLLISDGVSIISFAMLSVHLNNLILENELTEFSICQINRYATTMIINSGRMRRVMVILNIDIKIPGAHVGKKIGQPTQCEGGPQNGDAG